MGINFGNSNVNVGGDVVGRDKITGDLWIFIPLDNRSVFIGVDKFDAMSKFCRANGFDPEFDIEITITKDKITYGYIQGNPDMKFVVFRASIGQTSY